MCTRILWNSNNLVVAVGRTMDWPDSTMPMLTSFPRGRAREGGKVGPDELITDNPLRWTSTWEAADAYPGARLEVEVVEAYRNMKEYLKDYPHVIEAAQEAVRRAGLEPTMRFVRGGTDGSRLSEMGLPAPNIFTGGHDFHSRHEWSCVADMGAAVATIMHLVQIWAEETTKGETS